MLCHSEVVMNCGEAGTPAGVPASPYYVGSLVLVVLYDSPEGPGTQLRYSRIFVPAR